MVTHMCPVCGFGMDDPPEDFNIGPSCGTEFGNNDANASIDSLRAAWLESGAKWRSPVGAPPDSRDPYKQLNTLVEHSAVSR